MLHGGIEQPEYRRKQKEAAEHRCNTTQHEQNIRAVTTLSTRIDNLAAEHRAYREQQGRHENNKRFREWITIIVISATALLALITILVTHFDTKSIIGESERASKQQHSDTLAALQKTDDAISEAARLANETKRMADVAQNNLVFSRRPWLFPVGGFRLADPFARVVGNTINLPVTATVKNFGPSPAINVTLNTRLYLKMPFVIDPVEYLERDVCQFYKYDPKAMTIQHVMPNDTVALEPLVSLENLEKGQKVVIPYIAACIIYYDQFGNPYATGQMLNFSGSIQNGTGRDLTIPGHLKAVAGEFIR
jgi:hypothetical protein